jgi:hypothetical protein
MILAGLKFILCLIGDIDESLSFFHDICEVTVIVGTLTNSVLSGLCGKFVTALVTLMEPFIICNAFEDCQNYSVSTNVSSI